MTLTLPNVFGTKPSGNVAASQLDTNYADLGAQAIIQCSVGGSANAIALTLSNIAVTAFTDIQDTHFGFEATATSTGVVVVNIAALGNKNLYKQDGITQCASGDIVSGQYYEIVYRSALNGSAGGAQIVNQTVISTGSPITNSLGANVTLNNVANYFDGPSVAQGTSGTWFASGTVTLFPGGTDSFDIKLWDGTTIIQSARVTLSGVAGTVSLSGYLSGPAGNIRISVRDESATTGLIVFNASGNSKDSTISAFRLS